MTTHIASRGTTRILMGLIGVAFIASSTLAQQAVYSVNVVGFQKVPVEQGLDIQSNPFEGMLIRDVAGNDGVYGNALDVADNVLLYDPLTQNYQVYYLRSHSSIGYPEWRQDPNWATNVYIQPGQGFFYRSRASGTRTNIVAGDVVMAAAITNTIRPGLQLLAYPFSTRTLLSDMNLKNGVYGNALDVADNVMVYDVGTQNYQVYYLRSHSSIGHPEWRQDPNWATNVYIEAGQGFWFRSRSVSAYEWVENTPYPDL